MATLSRAEWMRISSRLLLSLVVILSIEQAGWNAPLEKRPYTKGWLAYTWTGGGPTLVFNDGRVVWSSWKDHIGPEWFETQLNPTELYALKSMLRFELERCPRDRIDPHLHPECCPTVRCGINLDGCIRYVAGYPIMHASDAEYRDAELEALGDVLLKLESLHKLEAHLYQPQEIRVSFTHTTDPGYLSKAIPWPLPVDEIKVPLQDKFPMFYTYTATYHGADATVALAAIRKCDATRVERRVYALQWGPIFMLPPPRNPLSKPLSSDPRFKSYFERK